MYMYEDLSTPRSRTPTFEVGRLPPRHCLDPAVLGRGRLTRLTNARCENMPSTLSPKLVVMTLCRALMFETPASAWRLCEHVLYCASSRYMLILLRWCFQGGPRTQVLGTLSGPKTSHAFFRNPKIYPHPRLQDFPSWKKTLKNTGKQ